MAFCPLIIVAEVGLFVVVVEVLELLLENKRRLTVIVRCCGC